MVSIRPGRTTSTRDVALALALFVASSSPQVAADAPPETALRQLDERLGRSPTNVTLLLERSVLLVELRRFEAALSTLDRAVALLPDDPRIPVFRAAAELARGRADVARAQLDVAMRRHPDDRAILLAHATACEALDDVDAALDDLQAALILRYDDELALRVGRLLRARGRRDAADRILLDGASREPAHPALLLEAVSILRARGEFTAALVAVDRLAVGAAVPTETELLRAAILRQAGRSAASAGAYRRALALANEALSRRVSAAALVHRARARMGLGDFENALIDLEAARALAPRLPSIASLVDAARALRHEP